MTPLTIRELTPDAGTRRFAVRLWEGENVLTETELRALRDAIDGALVPTVGYDEHINMFRCVTCLHPWRYKSMAIDCCTKPKEVIQ